jgi:hypothetical protein
VALRIYSKAGHGGFLSSAGSLLLGVEGSPYESSYYLPGFSDSPDLGDDPARYFRW